MINEIMLVKKVKMYYSDRDKNNKKRNLFKMFSFFFFLNSPFVHFFLLGVKNSDKMKNEDSSSPFEAFHSILIFLMLLFIQELFLKRKDHARDRKSTAIYHHT